MLPRKSVNGFWCSLAVALLAGSGLAHDYWVESAPVHPQVGELVQLRHFVGHPGHAEERGRSQKKIERFFSFSDEGQEPVIGRDGFNPAGLARFQKAGPVWIGYESKPTHLDMPGAKFSSYLKEEGLLAVLKQREQEGLSDQIGRETYSRCAKTLVRVGDLGPEVDESAFCKKTLGLPLELVPQSCRYDGPDAAWKLTLLYRGRPLANAMIEVMSIDDPKLSMTARTNAQGRADFQLPTEGRWLAAAVHMLPADDGQADWRSYWASLVVQLESPLHPPG